MSHPLFDLSGRVAMVSGAASGMGRQMAIGFAEAGADVVLVDINLPGTESTAGEIEPLGGRVLAIGCDVSDIEQIRNLYTTIDSEFGRVDIVGNVAGEGNMGRPEDLPLDKLQETLQNLVVGRFASCQEAGRRMLEQGRGSIIKFRIDWGLELSGSRAYPIWDGDGCCDTDDTRIIHRMGLSWRASKCHSACAGLE